MSSHRRASRSANSRSYSSSHLIPAVGLRNSLSCTKYSFCQIAVAAMMAAVLRYRLKSWYRISPCSVVSTAMTQTAPVNRGRCVLWGSWWSRPQSSKYSRTLAVEFLPFFVLQILTLSQITTPARAAASRRTPLVVSGTLHTNGRSPTGRSSIVFICCGRVFGRRCEGIK